MLGGILEKSDRQVGLKINLKAVIPYFGYCLVIDPISSILSLASFWESLQLKVS